MQRTLSGSGWTATFLPKSMCGRFFSNTSRLARKRFGFALRSTIVASAARRPQRFAKRSSSGMETASFLTRSAPWLSTTTERTAPPSFFRGCEGRAACPLWTDHTPWAMHMSEAPRCEDKHFQATSPTKSRPSTRNQEVAAQVLQHRSLPATEIVETPVQIERALGILLPLWSFRRHPLLLLA